MRSHKSELWLNMCMPLSQEWSKEFQHLCYKMVFNQAGKGPIAHRLTSSSEVDIYRRKATLGLARPKSCWRCLALPRHCSVQLCKLWDAKAAHELAG